MKILCKLFGHKPETIGTNSHQISTHEKCERCGLSRKLYRVSETDCFQWVYSDGRKSVGVPMTLEQDIEFGDIH